MQHLLRLSGKGIILLRIGQMQEHIMVCVERPRLGRGGGCVTLGSKNAAARRRQQWGFFDAAYDI